MKNKEKYEKYFSEYEMCDRDAPWHDAVCRRTICKGCIKRFIKWSEQEATPDLTGLEEEILKAIDPVFEFIARDESGKLFVYSRKPEKFRLSWTSTYPYARLPLTGLFDWIRFEDEEPWCIDDIVKR